MIARMAAPAQPPLAEARAADPVVRRYRAFFALLDWRVVPERAPTRPWPGPCPHPRSAFIKALLVKLCEGKAFITQLRTFLVEHPLLVLELGFRPVVDPSHPTGFDVERTVPCARWLRHQQQHLDRSVLQALLRGTVQALQAAIPGLGSTVVVDVKHIYAWVQQNNPKAWVTGRFNPQRQPRGDPDCRLGVKRRGNQREQGGTTGETEYLWGYGAGVAAATDRQGGDVVLAEWTQPFNEHDLTYFSPLYQQTVVNGGGRPRTVAADAAFDAWHVYQPCAEVGGIAAIPLNRRGRTLLERDAQGRPACAQGYPMAPHHHFRYPDGARGQRYACPLLLPHPTGQTCPHPRFVAGTGCVTKINLELGGLLRVLLDRQADQYKAIYRQRTAAERINSQATALGIERPKVRNRRSVAILNTLTYLVINVRAIQRVQARTAQARAPTLC